MVAEDLMSYIHIESEADQVEVCNENWHSKVCGLSFSFLLVCVCVCARARAIFRLKLFSATLNVVFNGTCSKYYRIAGKFRGRKFRDFVQNQTFRGFNFAISNLQNISLAGKLLS